MACKTDKTEIDGLNIVVTQWPVDKSLLMKFRLARIAGPALMKLLEGQGNASAEDMIGEAFITVINNTNSSPEVITAFIKDCFTTGGVHINGAPVNDAVYLETFSGDKMLSLYKALGFILRVNYAGLMPGPATPEAGQDATLTGENTPT